MRNIAQKITQHYTKGSFNLVDSQLATLFQDSWKEKDALDLKWESALLQTCEGLGQRQQCKYVM